MGPNSGPFAVYFCGIFSPGARFWTVSYSGPVVSGVGCSSTASTIAARSAARLHSESWLCRPSVKVGPCSGGGFGPGHCCTGRSFTEGNPHRAPVTPSSYLVGALWERWVGAGTAGNHLGTIRCHRGSRLLPGPPAAVFPPGALECQSGTD
jgi:hypothetical protein